MGTHKHKSVFIKDASRQTGSFLSPRYDELTLYFNAISFALLIFLNVDFRNFLNDAIPNSFSGTALTVMIASGAILAVYNVFFERKKSRLEKTYMLSFLIVSNFVVAYYALSLIPGFQFEKMRVRDAPLVMNFFYSVFLAFLWRFKMINESNIADDDAQLPQVLVMSIPLVVVFLACRFIFNAAWYTTYSWSVFAAVLSKDLVLRFLPLPLLFSRPGEARISVDEVNSGSNAFKSQNRSAKRERNAAP